MSAISFFLSSDDIKNITQSESQSYGPIVENSTSTRYRVTTKLSAEGKPVYSVSEGEIIVTNSENPTLVNIFLQPKINYAKLSGIPKIKYFVYRGIKKLSFFDEKGDVRTTDENEILKFLNKGNTSGSLSPEKRRKNFKESFNTIENISDHPNDITANFCIDSLYVQEDYCQINISDSCKSLGIASAQFGFEIMLEENGFNPTITHARLLENTIDISSSLSAIDKEVKKLEILNYIDPAAFFGLFALKGNTIIDPFDKEKKQESKIYDTFISKFISKNRVYLDLRNKYALPVDISKPSEKFSSIKISLDGSDTTTEKPYRYYATENSEVNVWPIFIISSGFSNRQSPPSTVQYFNLKISLPVVYIKNRLIHTLTNHLRDSWPIGKSANYDVKKRYSKVNFAVGNNWSNPISLAVFAKYNTNDVVSTYVRLEYTEYANEEIIKDQIVNYKLHELSAESISNQLSPTLIDLGQASDLTREKNASGNKYNTYISGWGNTLFSETKGIACELTQGKAIDSIGEVCFAYKTANNIQVSGITLNEDRIANKGEVANQIYKSLFEQSFTYNKVQNHFEEKLKIGVNKNNKDVFRSYDEYVEVHNFYKNNKSILSVHKVKFVDDGDKKTLEVRVNDPVLLKGLTGNSPAECFLSIAYTYSQRETILGLVNNNFVSKRFVTFVSDTITEITNSGRKVFKQVFKLLGLKTTGNSLELQEEPLNLTFYSIDGSNFVTPEYADLFKNEFGKNNRQIDRIITNDVIPQFETGNPFDTIIFEAIITAFTNISDNGNRDRILYNEIRDYLYDGDLDSLTFEMAFRLPFYIEDITKVPYSNNANIRNATNQNMGTDIDSKKQNNPYYDKFEDWYNLANGIRNSNSSPPLHRNGLTGIFDNKSIDAYRMIHPYVDDIQEGIPEDFFTKQYNDGQRGKVFKDNSVPAHVARVMIDENFVLTRNYKSKPHLPGLTSSWSDNMIVVPKNKLSDLVTAGIISSDIKSKLDSLLKADFGFTTEIDSKKYTEDVIINEVTYKDLNLSNTCFLFKNADETDFRIAHNVKQTDGGASGITFGFGFDMGQQYYESIAWKDNITLLNKYTPINPNISPGNWTTNLDVNIKRVTASDATPKSIKKLEVFKMAFADVPTFRGDKATDLLKVFESNIWNELDFPYVIAVEKFKDFILREYGAVKFINYLYRNVINPVFRLDQSNINNTSNPYYFQPNGIDPLNEIENFFGITFVYNGGQVNLTLNSTNKKYRRFSRYLNHAFNTHDIRWLRFSLIPPIQYSRNEIPKEWILLNISRINQITPVLFGHESIKHYRK